MAIILNDEKKKHMEKVVKTLRELDAAITPFREQKIDMKKSYIDNEWLTAEEYDIVKSAYNALKRKVDMSDLATVMDAVRAQMPE